MVQALPHDIPAAGVLQSLNLQTAQSPGITLPAAQFYD